MQVYRIASTDGEMSKYFVGATESSKQARDMSRTSEETFSVYEFSTPKTYIDKDTFLGAINEEKWCEPVMIAQFKNGRATKD